MFTMKFLVLVLAMAASTHALNCSPLLPAKICGKVNALGNAMTTALIEANGALVDAVKEASFRATELYKAGFAIIKDKLMSHVQQLTGKLNQIKTILDSKLTAVTKAQRAAADRAVEAIAETQGKATRAIEEAVVNAKPSDARATMIMAHTFNMTGPSNSISDAMTTARRQLRMIIASAVSEANSVVKEMKSFIEALLQTIGGTSSDVQFFNAQVGLYLKSMESNISSEAEQKADASIQVTVVKATELMDELEIHSRIGRRSISDLWNKVKASLQQLGNHIVTTTKDVIEKQKPAILAALKKFGNVLVDTGKKILLELAAGLVTATIGGGTNSTATV